MSAGLAAVGGLGALAVGRPWRTAPWISPDGRRYLIMARDKAAPLPFALRWLLPSVCRTSVPTWRLSTGIHLVLLVTATAVWMSHWVESDLASAIGGLLVVGLPGIWRIHLRMPVLVDAAAMAWSLVSAILALRGLLVPALLVALLAASIKESSPIFAAIYATSPELLLAMAGPLVRRCVARTAPDPENEDDILRHPLRTGLAAHRGRWLDLRLMLMPWGVCLTAPLVANPEIRVIVVVALLAGYAQLLVAFDTVRLYQWAAPPMILALTHAVPTWGLAVLLPAHLLNPWAGEGY